MMLFLLVFGAVFVSVLSAGQCKANVVMCSSFSCVYNKKARCTKKEVAIYDNTVKGLCLDHSESMDKRILEPMGKIMQAQEEIKDSELLKNPKAFAKWMRKQGGIL